MRLPGGATQQRRFPPAATVNDVRKWVATLDEMPLSAVSSVSAPAGDGSAWKIVTSFPRSEPEGRVSVRELAAGSAAVALFVELS